jgi:hypothetical protein
MFSVGTFLNAESFRLSGLSRQGKDKVTSHLDLKEDDPNSKRIAVDTAEWHRRLEELAKLRQLETSDVSPPNGITASCSSA